MSSSPKVSSSTYQATIFSKTGNSKDRHCQTIYDNGRRRCIVETRRRSSVARGAGSDFIGYFHAMPSMDSRMMKFPERSSPDVQSSYPSSETPTSKSEGLALSREKGLKPYHKSPRRVVIVPVALRPCTSELEGQGSTFSKWVEPTPPPTPRLGRLPTPEFSDLDEAPFCECDQAVMMRCCASCKKTIGHAVY
jgi:hypothetical protein